MKILAIILLVLYAINAQNATITLQPEKTYFFQLQLPADLTSNSEFFFVVQWPTDPLQNPFIDIYADQGAFWSCYNSNDEFNGVCSIPTDQLKPNSTITAEIYCFVECQLVLRPFLSDIMRIALNDTSTFTSSPKDPLLLEIQMQVPPNLNFTQIALYAQIQSIEKASEGLEMYANIGNASRERPNKMQFDSKGESIFWGGKGVFLSKEMVRAGDWIKLYLQLSPGMQIKLFSSVLNGNYFQIELGKSYFDFTSYSQDKIYKLDLSKQGALIAGKTVSIGFIVYSGSPYVDIAMDNAFLNSFSERGSVAAANYQITQTMRKQENFTGIVYIKVTSFWNADYLIYTQVQAQRYMNLFPDIDIYNELQPNQVYNYFFDDIAYNNDNSLRNYSLRVDVITGKVKFGIRRCKSAQISESILDCVINDISFLKNSTILSSFQEIDLTLKKNDIYYYLMFQVNTSECTPVNSTLANYCSFHIAAIEDANLTTHYTVTLNKRQYHSTLREGQLARDLVFKNEYLFYRFVIGSLDNVESITFYSTIIQGDLYLIASTVDQFPTLESEGQNLFFSVGNFLTFQKDELAKAIYITVYGIQLSQFSLGVKVTRKDNQSINSTANTNQTELAIKLDLSQEFTFQQADTAATFLIKTDRNLNITTEVMMLAGTVSLQIKDSTNNIVNCSDQSVTNSKITCSFSVFKDEVYRAIVSGKKGEVQKFIILYHQQDSCLTYSLNMPLYLQLQKGQQTCVLYSLSKLTELQITSSVPLSHLIDQSLSMVVCLNQHCLEPATSHHQSITKNELISFCNFTKTNNSNVLVSCLIKILFSSNSAVSFQVIAEETGRDVGLFDGIVEKVSSSELTHEKGKYFYYDVYEDSAIKIFFTSFTSTAYYIALHFVEQTAFLKNTSAIYLPYRETNYETQQSFEQNFYQTIVYGSYTNIFTISSAIVQKYCDECVLAMSIYPWYVEAHSMSSFQIEISQTQTLLFLGDSKIGYRENNEIYNYQLEPSDDSDALISIKDLSRQSNSQEDCFSASLTSDLSESPQSISNGLAYIKKGSQLNNLYVQAMDDFCSYEVTYTRVDFPLVLVTASRKYPFQRDTAGKMYLLYTHTENASFKIIQIINTGALTVYATPVLNHTIAQLLSADPASFAFVDADSNGEFTVKSSSAAFCWNCQYLIAAVSSEPISAEIIVAGENSSIPLSVNGIIKEKLVMGDSSIRNYTFNSISAFNITFSPIYGKLNVVVIDPSKNVMVNSTIANSQNFLIPHNNKTESFSYDYNSYFTRYQINVAGLANSSYTIKVSKESITSRIFEGIPYYYDFQSNETIRLEFLNLNLPNQHSNSLNILVDLIDFQADSPKLTAAAAFESKEGNAPALLPISSLRLSDNVVYNIQLPLKMGTYYISLTVGQPTSTSITLVKQSLIHLAPSSSAIMFKPALFQLYSASKAAMIEVFTCYGDLRISASNNYNNLSDSKANLNEIVLEQSNYGGHFVINAQRIYGQYFIKVMARKEAEQGYLITYHYYQTSEVPPYKLIDIAEREITYAFSSTAIIFRFSPISINWQLTDSIDSVLVQYHLFIADSKIKVGQYANCRLGSIYQVNAQTANIHDDFVEIAIEMSDIGKIVGEEQIYFVGAEAQAMIEPSEQASDDYPSELKLIYDIIELTNIKTTNNNVQPTTSYSPQVIILWFLLPFAIAGAILYFALKYCIKKYRGLLPNELMEEAEHGESEQAVQSRSPFDGKANVSQQMKDQV